MEDIFEAIIAIVLVVFAISRKSRKNKAAEKKKEQGFSEGGSDMAGAMPEKAAEAPNAKKAPAVQLKLEKAMRALEELEDEGFVSFEGDAPRSGGKNKIPDVPAPAVTPAAPAPQPVPAMPMMGVEGECDHPEHVPVVQKVKEAEDARRRDVRGPRKQEPETKARKLPTMTAREMRRAVITAEVLSRPVALRAHGRRI